MGAIIRAISGKEQVRRMKFERRDNMMMGMMRMMNMCMMMRAQKHLLAS